MQKVRKSAVAPLLLKISNSEAEKKKSAPTQKGEVREGLLNYRIECGYVCI